MPVANVLTIPDSQIVFDPTNFKGQWKRPQQDGESSEDSWSYSCGFVNTVTGKFEIHTHSVLIGDAAAGLNSVSTFYDWTKKPSDPTQAPLPLNFKLLKPNEVISVDPLFTFDHSKPPLIAISVPSPANSTNSDSLNIQEILRLVQLLAAAQGIK